MTSYSDTPVIVTLLAIPQGVTVSEEVCMIFICMSMIMEFVN